MPIPQPHDGTQEPAQPRGSPVRKGAAERPEWEAVPGRPGLERNTRTGALRTNLPTPGTAAIC